MRILIALLAALLLVPAAFAAESEHAVYLHDQGSSEFGRLHLTPPVINARVGDTLRITVHNQGSTLHNLIVCADGVEFESTCDESWGRTPNLEAGQTAPLTVQPTKAGRFEYYCDIAGHKGGGMRGELVVQGDATESKGMPLGPLALVALAAGAWLAHRRPAA